MKIVLTESPIEKIFSQCAVCFLPQEIRPLKGAVGIVDWALNGLITRLLRRGSVSGNYLESILIRPGRFLACEKLLVLGMGVYDECHEERIGKLGGRLIHILSGLHVNDISLSFPAIDADQPVDVFAEHLTKGFLAEEDEDEKLATYLEQVNIAISCVFEQIDEALLGIQKAKVALKKHFNVIILE